MHRLQLRHLANGGELIGNILQLRKTVRATFIAWICHKADREILVKDHSQMQW